MKENHNHNALQRTNEIETSHAGRVHTNQLCCNMQVYNTDGYLSINVNQVFQAGQFATALLVAPFMFYAYLLGFFAVPGVSLTWIFVIRLLLSVASSSSFTRPRLASAVGPHRFPFSAALVLLRRRMFRRMIFGRRIFVITTSLSAAYI